MPFSTPPPPIDRTIVHYARNDPRRVRGGVESFAKNLGLVFREVLFMTPESRDLELVRTRRLPVVCDNQWVLDWPAQIPVLGFQHGVAWRKFRAIGGRDNAALALAQARAARRPNTLWLACARWIGETFGELHGNRAAHVIYHPVDLERFDGSRPNPDPRLLLHDGRTPHKGSRVYAWLSRARPDYRFEALDCAPERVPERLRQGAAFLHLGSYEGNSIVCNEAMAMDLPCFFTRVGLLLDGVELDVASVPRSLVYGPWARLRRARLLAELDEFLASLAQRRYRPRRWVEENASLAVTRERWQRALADFDAMPWA